MTAQATLNSFTEGITFFVKVLGCGGLLLLVAAAAAVYQAWAATGAAA